MTVIYLLASLISTLVFLEAFYQSFNGGEILFAMVVLIMGSITGIVTIMLLAQLCDEIWCV